MALIDVSELLTDPDVTTAVTLIRRASSVNEFGENALIETPVQITAVVQSGSSETITRAPEGVLLSDIISVYYAGILTGQQVGGYADVIIYNGRRYTVYEVPENFMNHGAGFTMANCKLEAVNAN
jgi:hypothetical protein